MSEGRAVGLSALFEKRLPINRKERYYTGTVLPMIVAHDGFEHLGRFLALCGMPEVAFEADPGVTNVQFFTEYGFKESLMDGAENRFPVPVGRDTPDIVIYIESEPALLLGVEAKVFLRPSESELREQLRKQSALLKEIASCTNPPAKIRQVALLPEKLGIRGPVDKTPVLFWERVVAEFRCIAPSYWIGVLEIALDRYETLKSPLGSGNNCDDKISGEEILRQHREGDGTFTWMGRQRGLDGPKLQSDLKEGAWRSQMYEVRYGSLEGNPNWFPIADFIRLVEQL